MSRSCARRPKAAFEKRNETKLTFMPFFVRACAEALRAFPLVNASVDGANVVLHGEINIGIAVALEAGLIVPVVKDAEREKFPGLAARPSTTWPSAPAPKNSSPKRCRRAPFRSPIPASSAGFWACRSSTSRTRPFWPSARSRSGPWWSTTPSPFARWSI